MKKNYFSMLFVMFSIAMFAQVTVVNDTLRAGSVAAFYAEYTAVASTTGTTVTLALSEVPGIGVLANVQEVEVYRSYGDNRVSGRTRIARFLPLSGTGTVVFVDDSQVYTEDSNSATGFTGDGAFEVGVPTAYSFKVIMADTSSLNSWRTVQSVYLQNPNAPTSVIVDPVNDDMNLQTLVFENYPTSETAILRIGLVPSTNYPTDPYALLSDASLAREDNGFVNWQNYPCFISEVLYNEVPELAGRGRDIPQSRIFWSNEGFVYFLVDVSTINSEDIAADGTTNVSYKLGRPNSTQPNNGFSYNATVSVPMQITAPLSVDDATLVSTVIKAIDNRITISNVNLQTEIDIYSINGALVKSISTNEDLDFEFNSGLYIATVSTSEGQKSVKLLVK